MTEEEKAEEYYYSKYNRTLNIGEEERHKEVTDIFLAGLHEGQPKWHKVADGDYPDTDRTVLAYSDDVVSGHYPYFAQYYKGFTDAKKNGVDLNWNCWRNNMQRELVEPTVWCEIPQFNSEE